MISWIQMEPKQDVLPLNGVFRKVNKACFCWSDGVPCLAGLMATYHAKNEYCLLSDMCQGYQVFVSIISQLEDWHCWLLNHTSKHKICKCLNKLMNFSSLILSVLKGLYKFSKPVTCFTCRAYVSWFDIDCL